MIKFYKWELNGALKGRKTEQIPDMWMFPFVFTAASICLTIWTDVWADKHIVMTHCVVVCTDDLLHSTACFCLTQVSAGILKGKKQQQQKKKRWQLHTFSQLCNYGGVNDSHAAGMHSKMSAMQMS